MAKRIGELLVEGGVLSQSQLEQALFAQRKDGRKLGQLLIELGLVTEVQLTQTLSRQLSVPWVSLYHVDFSRSLLNLVPREIAEKYCLVPIFVRRVRKQGETLYVAMDDPTNENAIADVARASALAVKPMIACPSDIRAAIRVYYLGETAADASGPTSMGAPSPPAAVTPPVTPGPGTPPAQSAPQPSVAAAPSGSGPRLAPAPPPIPERAKSRPEIVVPPPAGDRLSPVPARARTPSSSDIDAGADRAQRKPRPRMISLTLLDGTTISIPAPPKGKRESAPDLEAGPHVSDQLTARDLVSALRAVAHGADASEILGTEPRWEAIFSALLSILLRKGLIADWEFVEEFRKI
jgi:type IV pilus assembly protein PilB